MWLFLLIPLFFPASSPSLPGDDGAVRAALKAAAQTAWENQYAGMVAYVDIQVVRYGGEIKPEWPLKIIYPSSPVIPKSRAHVQVHAKKPAEGWGKVGWAWMQITHFDSVMVTTRMVSQDMLLEQGDATSVWMDVTTFTGTPLHPAILRTRQAAGTAFLKKTITANRALRLEDIRPPYAANTSETVAMAYNRNGIRLEMTCKARGRGVTGDVIRAYSPTSKRTYRIRLTGPGRGEWLETLN